VKEVANRPSTQPVREAEDVQFRSSAPGLPLYRLGGGLMKECVNLKIKNGRLRSRDKLKLYLDNDNVPNFFEAQGYTYERKFFTIPYNGIERKYWISSARGGSGGRDQIFWLNDSGIWVPIYDVGRRYYWTSLENFSAFRMNNLFNTNLWVLSINKYSTLVLVNDDVPRLRELGIDKALDGYNNDSSTVNFPLNRGFGFDLVQIDNGIPIRSSGVFKAEGAQGLTNNKMSLTLPYGNESFNEATHVRLWLSDRLLASGDDPNDLFPIIEFSIDQLVTAIVPPPQADAPIPGMIRMQGRNGFHFTVYKKATDSYEIRFGWEVPIVEPSFGSAEASLIEIMNLIPMPNAQCLSNNGVLFGIKPNDSGVIVYSSNPGTIFQEQTTALRVLQAGVGSLFRLVPVSTGVLAFGTKGVARVFSLGEDKFSVSKIAALDLLGMRAIALPGIGAVCVGKGKVIFVNESTFEASEEFMGLPIRDMLGDLANDVRAVNVADNKLYIIAGNGNDIQGNRIFVIDLDSGAMTEIVILPCYPMDLFSNDKSSMRFICARRAQAETYFKDPIVLSFGDGDMFEEQMRYYATFVESSAYGFIQHLSTQVLAKLGRCDNLETSINSMGFLPPMQFNKLKKADEYQDYFIPAGERSEAKTIELKLYFSSPLRSGINDGLDILSVKLTRLRQDEVSSPSYNYRG